MVVLSKAAGQGRTLVDPNRARARCMGKHDEGVECNGSTDHTRRRVGAPPVVGGVDCTRNIVQPASHRSAIAGNPTVLHGQNVATVADVHLNAAAISGGYVPRDRCLGNGGGFTDGVVPQTAAVGPTLVIADDCTLIDE